MLKSLPQVTKNILILNILFFLATLIFQGKEIDLVNILGTHYVNSPLFKPFQIITHFFMHANFFHILVNMWLFVMLGAFLERLWGPQRFFLFYIISALGAFALHNAMGVYEIHQLKQALISQNIPIDQIDNLLKQNLYNEALFQSNVDYRSYIQMATTPMVGASGAVFGVLAAFAILFPNTEFLIYFMFPVKAKYLVGAYLLFEVYSSFQNNSNDSVAHLAHIGGAIAGAILVLIWKKKDRNNFY
jgi:membrane associated rhomboid family serine protease